MTDYRYFDCDNHCYEPRDAFTRYLPEEYMDRAITTVRRADGQEMVLAGNRISTFNSEAGLCFETADRPGSLHQMLRDMASGNPSEAYRQDPMQPEFVDRDARLRLHDEQGIDHCVVYPGALALSAEHWVDDTDALYANLSSFNRWFDEDWGFNYQDRIYATAVLSLRDLDKAVALTDEIIERGAKVVMLPTGPAYGRSPGDPYFDPVWSRLAEAGVVVTLHVGPFWYFDAISPAWGLNPDPGSWHMAAWQWMNAVRRAAGHRHHLGAHLRQPVRSVPRSERAHRRARGELGAPHPQAHGQVPGDGPQRPVDRRPAHRASVGDLPPPRAGHALPGGRRARADRRARR